MKSLEFHWFGRPLIELGGKEIKMETRKATALLAYLSLSRGGVLRERLATLFWPEGSQQKALANLRRVLSSLRERLPDGILDANREMISLRGDGRVWLDVTAFDSSLSQARGHGHPQGELCNECLDHLKEATGYYRGPFMESFNLSDAPEFDDWQANQRLGYEGQLGWALETLSREEARQKEWEEAISHARLWVSLDRLNESAARWLIELYDQGGQKNAAIKQYQELVKLLEEQVGQEPEAETKILYEQLRGDAEVTERKLDQSTLPLLKTKLYIPALPTGYVARPRLSNRLKEVEDKAVTVISGPAGFGKTTLVAEWITQTELPAAWLSLDAGENDPYRFLVYLMAALDSIEEGIGAEAQLLLRSTQQVPPYILLVSLINDLGKVAHPFALVLDDYQFISEHAVHEIVSYLLDHVPSSMHIVIASRTDPPLQLGRLRAYGRLLELRTQDLRFNGYESNEFLNDIMGLNLSEKDVEALQTRTEGWIVGLKMAALSLTGSADPGLFIRAFSGSTRYILDYLVEEVIKLQPSDVQQFLLLTSVLEKMSGPLCDALVRDQGMKLDKSSQEILEYLERNNLFLVSLDDERKWFRYHHLFSDLLQMRVKQGNPKTEAVQHRAASIWFADNSYPMEAVDHALAAREYCLAADLIEKYSLSLIARSEIATLLRWINLLPDEITRSRPRLIIHHAWVLARLGIPGDLEKMLEEAENLLSTTPRSLQSDEMRSQLTQLRAFMANINGDADSAIHISLDGEEHKGSINAALSDVNYLVGFQLGYAYYSKGELAMAEKIFRSVSKSAEAAEDIYNEVISEIELAGIYLLKGDLVKAEQQYMQTQEWLSQKVENTVMLDGIIKVCHAGICLERNQLEKAFQLVNEGIEDALLGSRTNTLAHGYAILAQVLRAKGDLPGAREAVDRAIAQIEKHRTYPRTVENVRTCQVDQWLSEGNLSAARQWAKEEFHSSCELPGFSEELKNISLGRVLLYSQEFQEAKELLEKLSLGAQEGGRESRLIKINTLQALALQGLGKTKEALFLLERTLAKACQKGFFRVFLDEGDPLVELLILGQKQGIWGKNGLDEYVNKMLVSSNRMD